MRARIRIVAEGMVITEWCTHIDFEPGTTWRTTLAPASDAIETIDPWYLRSLDLEITPIAEHAA